MVTEASNAVCGMDQKDGYITAVVKSRDLMPSFDKKQAFWAPFYDWNTANVVQEQPSSAFLFSPDAQFLYAFEYEFPIDCKCQKFELMKGVLLISWNLLVCIFEISTF